MAMRRLLFIVSMLTAVLLGFFPVASAQRIVSMHIDSTHCNDSLKFTVGFSDANVIVIPPASSISHPQCIFLPDGTVCDSTLGTCTYRSPITFTAFNQSSIVTSAQDIDFVRLNIEHSWLGDIIIALECPNGQYVSLVNAHHAPQPEDVCGEPKFDGLVGWDTSYQFYTSAYLGEPVNGYSTSTCDTATNPPGIGWNYCWSENINHQYAPEDGLLYRVSSSIFNPQTHQNTVDSTHIFSNSQYYRPQQSFDSLIGCPLNGTWNIVVQDNWKGDNGYVFDWQLALNASLLAPTYIHSLVWKTDNGEWTTENDTTLTLLPPVGDTLVNYSLRIVLSSGDTIDTVFSVHWVTPFIESVTDTLCVGDTARWSSLFFTTDTLHLIRDTTVYGCDSIVDLSYTFMPSYSLHDTLPYCANEAFMYEGIDYGGPMTIVVPHLTQYGCDSTVTVHLVTIDSLFHLQLQMSSDGEEWSADTVIHGCQPFTLYLRDTTLFERWRRWDFGDGDTLRQNITAFQEPSPFTHTYDSMGVYTLSLVAESIHGCVDSSVVCIDALHVYSTPTAEFSWSPTLIVVHDPWTQFVNQSSPMDSLRFEWAIPTGEGGTDTTSEVSPYYRWPFGSSDMEVVLSAIWTHLIDDTLTLECVDTAMRTVVITNDYLQFPNLVTPNGDGVNDRWEIVNLLSCGLYTMNELWIYNKWGTLVYHVRDISREEDFWDPTPYPDGTYYYRFSAKSIFGIVRLNGTIEVVR